MLNFTSTTTLMTNITSIMSNQTPSLDELLDQLGFKMWETVLNTFILSPINLIGILLCSFSLWIFSRPSFEDPIFFYYKLLCFVNIIHLIHNIPECFLFSPYYFPMMNNFATSIFKIYYGLISTILFHYEDVLQMAILLHRMKLFIPFVRKNFKAEPQLISLALFFTCLLIDLPLAFSFKINSLGDYFYTNSKDVEQTMSFYFPISSNFSQTLFGQILIGLTSFFLNYFLTLLVGVVLSIVSYIKYKRFSSQKQREFEQLQMSSINNRPTTSRELEQQRQRERAEQQIERNMFRMSFTLCTISILSRILFIMCYFCFFIFNSFSNSLIITMVVNSIFTLVPTVSTFIFYLFNQMFRDETRKKLFDFQKNS